MATLTFSNIELNAIKDSLSSERLSISEDAGKNPELREYLEMLESLEKKLGVS